MTREEAIALLNEQYEICKRIYDCSADQRKSYPNVPQFMEALGMALSALRPVSREQVEKVWPGCPYCKEDGEGYVQKFGAYSIQNGELTTGHCKPQKIKFCPHCSSPLTDEAVQMVLERINKMEETGNGLG